MSTQKADEAPAGSDPDAFANVTNIHDVMYRPKRIATALS